MPISKKLSLSESISREHALGQFFVFFLTSTYSNISKSKFSYRHYQYMDISLKEAENTQKVLEYHANISNSWSIKEKLH